MDKLEIQYNNYSSTAGGVRQMVNVEATLHAIIDRVNELSEMMTPIKIDAQAIMVNNTTKDEPITIDEATLTIKSTPRFKADDINVLRNRIDGSYAINGFKSEAEAQAALEALLNL